MLKPKKVAPKCSCPFEPAEAWLKIWPYRVTGKGSGMVVPQSSQLLPMSVTPGTSAPLPKANV
jgi:hypothetical protein